jgi:hypothetical protein
VTAVAQQKAPKATVAASQTVAFSAAAAVAACIESVQPACNRLEAKVSVITKLILAVLRYHRLLHSATAPSALPLQLLSRSGSGITVTILLGLVADFMPVAMAELNSRGICDQTKQW